MAPQVGARHCSGCGPSMGAREAVDAGRKEVPPEHDRPAVGATASPDRACEDTALRLAHSVCPQGPRTAGKGIRFLLEYRDFPADIERADEDVAEFFGKHLPGPVHRVARDAKASPCP